MKIKKNDTVLIISGKDKGKKGKVRQSFPKDGKLTVEGINMIKRHSKTQGKARQAGIIEMEEPMAVSKVMLICNKCNKPVKVGYRVLEGTKKARICRSCNEIID